jgi:hypothetical protein
MWNHFLDRQGPLFLKASVLRKAELDWLGADFSR